LPKNNISYKISDRDREENKIMTNESIIIIATDYDMEVHDVRRIVENHPTDYYEKLEEFIKEREENQNVY
jgi:hypothetical protein